jgi:hypothetical protein
MVGFRYRYQHHGHLFRNEYPSIVCHEDVYLYERVRYIHLKHETTNPKAKEEGYEANSFWFGDTVLDGRLLRRLWRSRSQNQGLCFHVDRLQGRGS